MIHFKKTNSLILKQLVALDVKIAQAQPFVYNVWGVKTKIIQDY
jgi:hypothetical protein